MKTQLILYDAACRALAEASSVDEVKDVRDQAMAIKLYARQAKNKDLEAQAIEIRTRAERRVGQMMAEQPKARAGNPNWGTKNPNSAATLDEAGVDKNLAKRARKYAAMDEDEFEGQVSRARERVYEPEEPSNNEDEQTIRARGFLNRAHEAVRLANFDHLGGISVTPELSKAIFAAADAWNKLKQEASNGYQDHRKIAG